MSKRRSAVPAGDLAPAGVRRLRPQPGGISHSTPRMSADGGHWMEVKLSFRRQHSCLSVRLLYVHHSLSLSHTHASRLVVSAVPRQLLLVEVDDHLGTAGAGFTGRQQGHVVRVLPVGGTQRRRRSIRMETCCF